MLHRNCIGRAAFMQNDFSHAEHLLAEIAVVRIYAANYISSIVKVDRMVAARLVDSLATLESSLCKLSVGLYLISDSNRKILCGWMRTCCSHRGSLIPKSSK